MLKSYKKLKLYICIVTRVVLSFEFSVEVVEREFLNFDIVLVKRYFFVTNK